jgi:hypothetical protein
VTKRENPTDRDDGLARAPAQTLLSGEAGRVPDAQTQLEALLDQVWRCEADWCLNDRIDLALRIRRRAR